MYFYIFQQPWSVAIVLPKNDDSNGTKLHCSGSILDERTILTAAHCFLGEYPEDQSKMTIIVGANQPTNEQYLKKRKRGVSRRKIKSVKIHPLYNNVLFSAKYDLALVEIEGRSLKFKQTIWPICVPEKVRPREYHFEKGYSLVGFGKNTIDPDKCGNFECLKQDQLNVQTTEYCSIIYGQILGTPFDHFHDLIQKTLPRNFDEEDCLMCAQIPGQNPGTCKGDSGGILMNRKFYQKRGWIATQQAVVHGSRANCDGMRFPSIFVRLDNSEVLAWIFENVFPNKQIGPDSKKKSMTTPQPTRLRNTPLTCSDYESDGYKCVPNIDCEGTLSIRSEALDYYDYEDSNPICSDPLQTCCHQDRIKKVCKTKEFQCLNGGCIPAAYVCDSDEDCQDGSDEIDCQSGEKLCALL